MRKNVLRIALALFLMLGIVAGATTAKTNAEDAACSHPLVLPHVLREASCTQTGIYCTSCWFCDGIISVQELSVLPHKWQRVSTVTPATCTETGVAYCRCTECGTTAYVTIPATGHSMITTYRDGGFDRYCITCEYRES